MITRTLKVEEVICRTRSGGPSYFVSMTVDEVGPVLLRLSREEHDEIAHALASGARFAFSMRLAPPTLDTLASRDAAAGAP